MMNGGKTFYIYKDGFGDVYNATPAEEAQWKAELLDQYRDRLSVEDSPSILKQIIENLEYHQAEGLIPQVESLLETASSRRKTVLVSQLWRMTGYPAAFSKLVGILKEHRETCLDEVFLALIEMKGSPEAAAFLWDLLQSDDTLLAKKAHTTLVMWAYTGLPELRKTGLETDLKPEVKTADPAAFSKALAAVRRVLRLS